MHGHLLVGKKYVTNIVWLGGLLAESLPRSFRKRNKYSARFEAFTAEDSALLDMTRRHNQKSGIPMTELRFHGTLQLERTFVCPACKSLLLLTEHCGLPLKDT
jgi:hypothetical protein